MHLDGCVEVEGAHFGLPSGWIAIAKEEQTKKNSTTEVVRTKKPARGVRSIE